MSSKTPKPELVNPADWLKRQFGIRPHETYAENGVCPKCGSRVTITHQQFEGAKYSPAARCVNRHCAIGNGVVGVFQFLRARRCTTLAAALSYLEAEGVDTTDPAFRETGVGVFDHGANGRIALELQERERRRQKERGEVVQSPAQRIAALERELALLKAARHA